KQGKQYHGGAREANGAAVLADVFTVQFVLVAAMQRGGDIEYCRPEPGIAQAQFLLRLCPAEVDVEGLVGKAAGEFGGYRGGALPVEIAGRGVPDQFSVG